MRHLGLRAFLVGAGLVAGAGLPAAVRPDGPPAVWRQAYHAWGEPAAGGGSTYVLTRAHDVLALDAATGAPRWRGFTGGTGEVPLGSVVRLATALAIAGDDSVVAFDRVTGRRVWRFTPSGDASPGLFVGDVDDDLVLAGSVTGRIFAIDTASGRLRWSRRVAPAARSTVFAPVLAGGHVVASYTTFGETFRGGVVAFDRHGRRLWRFPLRSGTGAGGAPLVAGDMVFVPRTDGPVEGVGLADGQPRWALPAAVPRAPGQELTRDVRPLARAGGLLVVGSLTGDLVAYDLQDRRERWRYADGPDGAAALRLRASGSTVFAPFTDGSLVAIDAVTGRERWRAGGAEAPMEWPPATDGQLVFVSADGAIAALSPSGETDGGEAGAGGAEDRKELDDE
jgi:outer membrane protein assembly factor BamB